MSTAKTIKSAKEVAEEAKNKLEACLSRRQSFILEAGAGAGKTHSLVDALNYLVKSSGNELKKHHQRIACITYTNVACNEIESRTDKNPLIQSDTIHKFCWSLIKGFQQILRTEVPKLHKWLERIKENVKIEAQKISYELGYRSITADEVTLHHDDVIDLTCLLLKKAKFRRIFAQRYPILLIDEYQDMNAEFAKAIQSEFLEKNEKILIGLFGDHWQKIYDGGCGKIEHPNFHVIEKHSNFRSVSPIVDVLNHMRPELIQQVKDPTATGIAEVYHTNSYSGSRRTKSHWEDDLFPQTAHEYLKKLQKTLEADGWDFSPEKTKILMLTHRVLAQEQGYSDLTRVFPRNESFIKKEDPHIAFFTDMVEPVCKAFEKKRYGEMFSCLDIKTARINRHSDKVAWNNDLKTLCAARNSETIGEVINLLRKTKRPRIPETVERNEKLADTAFHQCSDAEKQIAERVRKLRGISYRQVISLADFLNEHTCFSTQHGAKGAQFENVLVVVGRGWNKHNFGTMLAMINKEIPLNQKESFERSRNLFYVACSRAKKRLALLFTQLLSKEALNTLEMCFGKTAIHSM